MKRTVINKNNVTFSDKKIINDMNEMNLNKLYIRSKSKESEDLKKFQNGIDEIFNMDGIDRNIKSIYNSIKSDEYSVDKIKEKCENSKKKFEEVYKQYLLTNMKYKEELEVYNKRQEQILKENVDCKKEYNDINNYLNNFKIDNKEKDACKKLDDLIESF